MVGARVGLPAAAPPPPVTLAYPPEKLSISCRCRRRMKLEAAAAKCHPLRMQAAV